MGRKKHHFVPKLYLEAFQCASRRIHLYNLNRSLGVRNASLKDQCYRRKFYGPTDQVEQHLSTLEGHVAPLLRSIVTQTALPAEGAEEFQVLLAFVALQLLRTTVAANRINSMVDKTTKQAYSHEVDIEAVQVGYEDPVLASLGNVSPMLDAISDLRGHLAISGREAFITSDNPAFKYNQYCEGVDYRGVTGALSRGLQIFIPYPQTYTWFCTTVQLTVSD